MYSIHMRMLDIKEYGNWSFSAIVQYYNAKYIIIKKG